MTATKLRPAHGTLARSRRCNCPPCLQHKRRYKKAWRYAQLRGEPSSLVDSTPALDHIRGNLLPAAWTTHQIEYAAGIARDYVPVLLKEAPPRIYAATAAAILGLGPQDRLRNVPDLARLDPTGTRRRMQALAVKGHCIRDVLREMGCNLAVLQVGSVSAASARKVLDAYSRLWNTDGPSAVGAVRARSRGWVGPGAWDDDTIDDPRAVPNVGAGVVQWSAEDLVVEVEVAARSSSDLQVVAARLGTTVSNVERARQRVAARAKAVPA